MSDQFNFYPVGDQCIQVSLGNEISPSVNQRVRKLFIALTTSKIEGIIECVPTYCAVSVYYHPLLISYNSLVKEIEACMEKMQDTKIPAPYIIEIPTCYEGQFGMDLEDVAKHHSLTPQEVVKLHTAGEYLIYMLGFTPGYCYLGGMTDRIATPRLSKPRTLVPAGSVGIAENQTGIYPIDSPGGWRIIGRTPLELYNPLRENQPVLLEAGNYIRFVSITLQEYEQILTEVAEQQYVVKKYEKRV